jgi:hypothetical protein
VRGHEAQSGAAHATIEIRLLDGTPTGALTAKWPGRTCRATYLPATAARAHLDLDYFADGGIILRRAGSALQIDAVRDVRGKLASVRDGVDVVVVTNDHDLFAPRVFDRAAYRLRGVRLPPAQDYDEALADGFAATARVVLDALAVPGFELG